MELQRSGLRPAAEFRYRWPDRLRAGGV